MTSTRLVVAMAVAVASLGTPAEGQIADRVNAVRDGSVRMSFAAREGVCGWGGNVRMVSRTRETDDWESDCQGGPVRVVLVRRDGETTDIDTYIGGQWRHRTDATDLGTVSAPVAADYFLRLAASLDAQPGEDAVFPAAVADSATIWPELSDLARNDDRPLDIREAAVFWMGQTPDEGVVVHLEALVMSGEPREIREKAIFALSQHHSERASSILRGIAESDQFEFAVREKAIFWAGQMRGDGSELYDLYDDMASVSLRERLIFAYSQRKRDPAAVDKLIDIARNESNGELRRKAIFWLGQTRDPRAIDFLSELIGQ